MKAKLFLLIALSVFSTTTMASTCLEVYRSCVQDSAINQVKDRENTMGSWISTMWKYNIVDFNENHKYHNKNHVDPDEYSSVSSFVEPSALFASSTLAPLMVAEEMSDTLSTTSDRYNAKKAMKHCKKIVKVLKGAAREQGTIIDDLHQKIAAELMDFDEFVKRVQEVDRDGSLCPSGKPVAYGTFLDLLETNLY